MTPSFVRKVQVRATTIISYTSYRILHTHSLWCYVVLLDLHIILLLSCSASGHLELIKTSLLNIMWKQDLQWEANSGLVLLWFLLQYFLTLSVIIAGYAKQSWGGSTVDARYQVSLSSDVSFHPLSTCLGNDTSPQQLQTWLSHKGLINPMHWYFLRDYIKRGRLLWFISPAGG